MPQQFYRGNKFHNPYFPKHEKKRSRKRIIFLSLLAAVVAIGLVFFSTIFSVTKIEIRGAVPEHQEQIRDLVQKNISEYTRLPFVRTKKITQQLLEHFSFESVTVQKKYLHTIVVTVEERMPYAVWQSGAQSFLIDQTGAKIAPINQEEPRQPGLVYFFDESGSLTDTEQIIDQNHLERAVEISEILKKELSLDTPIIRLESSTSAFAKYLTHRGWEVYIDLNGDVSMQIEKLKTVLQSLDDQGGGLHYIDVRFTDRVYYQ